MSSVFDSVFEKHNFFITMGKRFSKNDNLQTDAFKKFIIGNLRYKKDKGIISSCCEKRSYAICLQGVVFEMDHFKCR